MTDRPEPTLSTPKALAIVLLPIAGIAACAVAAELKGTRGWWSLLPWIALTCVALTPGTAGWVAARTRASVLIASLPAIAFAVVVAATIVYSIITGPAIRAPEVFLLYLVPFGWILASCWIAWWLARRGQDVLAFLVGAFLIVAFVGLVIRTLFMI